MSSRPSGHSRREIIARGISLASLTLLGCAREVAPVPLPTPKSDLSVPLRVLIISDSESVDAVSRSWSASDDGQLEIQSISIPRSEAGRLRQEAASLARKTDVLIYPLILAGDLFAQSDLVELDPESLEVRAKDDSAGSEFRLPTALKTGVARFANQSIGLPLGGAIPALFTVDSIEAPKTWLEYDNLVSGPLMGQASEPTAPGWSGAMFLWRCLSDVHDSWLFDRESMEPVIANDSYIATLELMRQTHDRYASKRLTPSAIWTQIQEGKLRGGITFPPPALEAFPDLQVAKMPEGEATSRVLMDPFAPVASISAACRQSAYAKKFITWLASKDGASALSDCINGSKQVIQSDHSVVKANSSNSPYDALLNETWKTPLTLPGLQIINGGAYFEALDKAIGSVLENKSKPADALASVAMQWSELSKSIDIKNQLRVWNQAQGRRG